MHTDLKPQQVAWSVRNWCAATDLSPAYAYELLAAGKIQGVRAGGKRLITTSPRDFLDSMRSEPEPQPAGNGSAFR